ncbi:hypothetical protein HB364_25395 [Pseudoflavitalea sp. X16]|uniref:hypothetical protein n=1 Tax=Paraflavitalea devenefica TaxID=2716334 RepID=UPI001423F756|nr:hypothetical protein [Paraflavitalea devenefica]NII28443.1 hypothetical protein [Paraflavitalea devenefica]
MRITNLTAIYLFPLCLLLAQPDATTDWKAAEAQSCPTPNDFHFEYDDFGWTGSSCYYFHITEKYLVYHGSSFTQPVALEVEVVDVAPWGTSSSTHWVTVNPGQTRLYLGQDQEEWNDLDCNESQDWGEMSYHTYYLTGNYDCTP